METAIESSELELVVGRKYYRCYVDYAASPPEPIVETHTYLGYEECDTTSDECDKPYHFHMFTHFRGFYPADLANSQLIFFASRKQLRYHYNTFPQFIKELGVLMIASRDSEGIILPEHYQALLHLNEIGSKPDSALKKE